MTKHEEIEFDRVLEALDVARRRLREAERVLPVALRRWASGVLAEMEAAEGPAE